MGSMLLVAAYNSRWLYQIMHPWHWLTYGQNAGALQGVCAVLAFILIWRYTVYTRRMMQLAESTRRASITPVFTAKDTVPHYVSEDSEAVCRVSMTIRNIGQGPAAIFWAWHQPVSDKFSPSNSTILLQHPSTRFGFVPESDLMSGDSMQIHFDAYDIDNPNAGTKQGVLIHSFPSNRRWLFVVDAIDQAGRTPSIADVEERGEQCAYRYKDGSRPRGILWRALR